MVERARNPECLAVEWWPLERLIPYAVNARVCPEAAIAKVAGSIHEFGFRSPILVDGEGVIIAGHTRLLAAQRLELATVPFIVCADLSPAKVEALRLADNRTAQETMWNEELLGLEIEELSDLDVDLSLTGFDEGELAALLAKPTSGLTDEDEAPEIPEVPITMQGDLWLLGKHRLLCGDSTNAEDVQRLMNGKRAVLMATDPPYLLDYDGGNHPWTWGKDERVTTSEEKTKHWDAYVDHDTSVAFYERFLRVALGEALAEVPVIYQWFNATRVEVVLEAWKANGLLAHQTIIWHKSRPVFARCDFMCDFEPAMYGWVQGRRPVPKRRPPANARCVWDVDSREGVEADLGSVHLTIKPVELIRRPIEWHTRPGELVYEPFLGSGTALIAAEELGRSCYALELSPAFVNVAVLRWEAFTGAEATLDSDGRTFACVAEQRSK